MEGGREEHDHMHGKEGMEGGEEREKGAREGGDGGRGRRESEGDSLPFAFAR